jgi:hemolysin-activating ACP:hemolysin acyltransferase
VSGTPGLNPPDAVTFAQTLGNAVWLMTLSPSHKTLPISEVEARVAPAILLKQFRLYTKGKQPLAFLTWAGVSAEVKAKIEAGEPLELPDWRSGGEVVVLDIVAPFGKPELFREKFLADLAKAKAGKTEETAQDDGED